MAQAERSVSVVLKADVRDYVTKMDAASKATKDFATQTGKVSGSASTATKNLGASAKAASTDLDKATKSTKGFGDAAGKASDDATKASKSTRDVGDAAGKIGIGMAAAGAAIAVGIGAAVAAFAEFDQKMSNVEAVSNATAGEMLQLRDAALEAGAATKFSASQAADAEAELVKAGISVQDVLGGGLEGSLALAAAGNLDLAQAATISANAMNIFGLEGRDVGHIADVLAAGANKSAADVKGLGDALQQSGLVAEQMGLSLEETVGTLAAFADNGLKGSDAGTSLKTMLQRLVPSSLEAAGAMKDIGFSAFDAQGNMKSFDAVAQNLQDGLTGLTDKQKAAALSTIFGSDAVRAANVAFKLGADGVNEYTDAVNDQGAASRMAAKQMDNLKGDVENLRGSFETALIKGGSGANDALRGLTKTATDAVNAFAGLPDEVQHAALSFAAVASGALLLGGGLITAIPKIQATKDAIKELTEASPKAAGALGLLGKAAGVVAIASAGEEIKNMAAAAQVAEVPIKDLASGLAEVASGAEESADFASIFNRGIGPFAKNFDNASDALEDFGANARIALDSSALETMFGGAGQAAEVFEKRIGQIDKALALMVQGGNADKAAKAVQQLEQAAQDQGLQAGVVTAQLDDYKNALDTATVAGGAYADSTDSIADATSKALGGGKLLAGEIEEQHDAAEKAKDAYDKLTQAVKDYGDQVATALSATSGYEASIDKAAEVATKRQELQDQIAKLSASGAAGGDINKKFDADRAKIIKDFDRRIADAKDEADKARLRTDKGTALAENEADRKKALAGNADQIAKLKTQQEQYAKTLDLSTEAGRANQAMLLDIAETAKGSAVENFKAGEGFDSVRKKFKSARDTFIAQSISFGDSPQHAQEMADKLGLTDDNLKKLQQAGPAIVTVDANTVPADTKIATTQGLLNTMAGKTATALVDANNIPANAKITETDGLLDMIDGKLVVANIQIKTSVEAAMTADIAAQIAAAQGTLSQGLGFAGGGYTGPGGKYEPAGVVHRGEYVFTKEETAKVGVANLAEWSKKLRGYATGGPVQPRFASQSFSSATTNQMGGNVTNDRRIHIDNVNAADFASFEREAYRRDRLHALGRRGTR